MSKVRKRVKAFFWETQALARYGPGLLPRYLILTYLTPGAIRFLLREVR